MTDYIFLILAVLGLIMALHMICAATFLPPNAPVLLSMAVVAGFGFSVGVVVTAMTQDVPHLLIFLAASLGSMLFQSIFLWFHGYHVSGFVMRQFRS
jgi:hypothetical protein